MDTTLANPQHEFSSFCLAYNYFSWVFFPAIVLVIFIVMQISLFLIQSNRGQLKKNGLTKYVGKDDTFEFV